MQQNKEKALIFGSGLVYELISDKVLDRYELIGILDNDQKKHNTYINDTIVLNPNSIKNMDFDIVIIASSQIRDMAKQLINFEVDISKIKLGAEFALNKYFNKTNYDIELSLDSELNIIIENAFNSAGLMCIDLFDNRQLLFKENNISTLLGLCENNNRLPLYFELISKYYKDNQGLFIDIGGNIGTTSLEAINYKNVTKCIAFEPSSENFSLLNANISINKLLSKNEKAYTDIFLIKNI